MSECNRYRLRCYCDRCGDMIFESPEVGSEELRADWDNIVISIPGALYCRKCKLGLPNFEFTFKIHDCDTCVDHNPSDILCLRDTREEVDSMLMDAFGEMRDKAERIDGSGIVDCEAEVIEDNQVNA